MPLPQDKGANQYESYNKRRGRHQAEDVALPHCWCALAFVSRWAVDLSRLFSRRFHGHLVRHSLEASSARCTLPLFPAGRPSGALRSARSSVLEPAHATDSDQSELRIVHYAYPQGFQSLAAGGQRHTDTQTHKTLS